MWYTGYIWRCILIDKNKIFNAFKIATAAIGAIFCAELLALDFAISAGIVAILSVGATKKETFKTAGNRFRAFGVALLLSFLCFSLVGYTTEGFFLYLFFFILICQWRGWASAMAMNSVLISHFLTFGIMDQASLTNEILLYLIGTSFGVFVNLHLHENVFFMEKMEHETDEQIKSILVQMAGLITDRSLPDRTEECFVKIRQSLRTANEIAEINYQNKLRKTDTFDIRYIDLRAQQNHILYNIYKRVKRIHTAPLTAQSIADFLQYMADTFHKDNRADVYFDHFLSLQQLLEDSPLPETRKEFEDRAELYGILGDIMEFIQAKKDFMDGCQIDTMKKRNF